MKKKILLFGLGICLLFTACSEKKETEQGNQPDIKQEAEKEEGDTSEKPEDEKEIPASTEEPGESLAQPPQEQSLSGMQ